MSNKRTCSYYHTTFGLQNGHQFSQELSFLIFYSFPWFKPNFPLFHSRGNSAPYMPWWSLYYILWIFKLVAFKNMKMMWRWRKKIRYQLDSSEVKEKTNWICLEFKIWHVACKVGCTINHQCICKNIPHFINIIMMWPSFILIFTQIDF